VQLSRIALPAADSPARPRGASAGVAPTASNRAKADRIIVADLFGGESGGGTMLLAVARSGAMGHAFIAGCLECA
jgi:hypothetical protein